MTTPRQPTTVTPFLMFTGRAEEAMNFYLSQFPGARIESMERWGTDGPGVEGTVKLATFSVHGQRIMFADSPPVHEFTFTPSTSFFIACAEESEFEALCTAFSNGGKFLMPPDNYGFSARFAWVEDRFGISWQVNLP